MERKTINILIVALIPFFILIARPPITYGNIMTFDSAPPGLLIGLGYVPPDYIEDGIKMSLADIQFDVGIANHYDFWDGVVNIDTYTNGGAIRFEMENGSLFNLNSLYVRTTPLYFDPYAPKQPVWEILFSNGSNIFIDPGTDTLLSLGVNNLSFFICSVRALADHQYNFSLDNINMTQVPEPSTLLLLGSGLVGLVWYRPKKKMK